MSGLDSLGAFDYMSLLKGAGGMLSAGGAGDKDKDKDKEKQKLEEDKRKAEKSASTLKLFLIVGGVLVGLGGLVFLVGRRPILPPVRP